MSYPNYFGVFKIRCFDKNNNIPKAPLNQHNPYVIKRADFQLNGINWTTDNSKNFSDYHKAMYIVDSTTGKKYLNEDKSIVRLKCIYPGLLFIPLLSIVVGIINIVYRSLKLLSGYHFWGALEEENIYEFKATLKIGGEVKNHTFKARFDDLSLMKSKLKIIEIQNKHDNVYDIIVTNEKNEKVTIQDLKTLSTISHHKNLTLSTLKKVQETYNLERRFINCLLDIARIAASTIIILPLVLSALYGLWKPYEGRKLISSIALAVCGTDKVAACFAPSPEFHALGGDMNSRCAF